MVKYFGHHISVVPPGIAADMGDPYIHLFAKKTMVFGIIPSDLMIVDISIYRPKWFECSKSICRFELANIAGMPNLIAILKKLQDTGFNMTMGIGKQTYSNHLIEIEIKLLFHTGQCRIFLHKVIVFILGGVQLIFCIFTFYYLQFNINFRILQFTMKEIDQTIFYFVEVRFL